MAPLQRRLIPHLPAACGAPYTGENVFHQPREFGVMRNSEERQPKDAGLWLMLVLIVAGTLALALISQSEAIPQQPVMGISLPSAP
jgi:hypothetical protein